MYLVSIYAGKDTDGKWYMYMSSVITPHQPYRLSNVGSNSAEDALDLLATSLVNLTQHNKPEIVGDAS